MTSLAMGQQSRGHQVHVAAIVDRPPGDYPMLAALRDAGVTVHPITVPPRAYWAERVSVEGLLRRLSPDIVHTHGYRPDLIDAPVARRLDFPTVTTVHGFTGGGLKNRIYEQLQRRAFRQFQAVIAVARSQVDVLLRSGVRPARIRLLRNAWTPRVAPLPRAGARAALGVPDGLFHIGWVGRLSGEKDPYTLLHALKAGIGADAFVSIVGDGAARRPLETLSASLGLGPNVRVHGALPDAVRLFSAFDLFVLTSRTEGTPLVLFEAMSAGVPIVATAVGGVPDVVAGSAVLVPPGDPDALAMAIRGLRNNPDRAIALARRARSRLERFSPGPWLGRHDEVYRRARQRSAMALAQ